MEQIEPEVLLARAETLYGTNNNKELEMLFSRYLRRSYDTRVWSLYIKYVRNAAIKKVDIADVYAFVLNHFEHSYDKCRFVREYIAELQNTEDDALKTEKIRKIYHRALSTPMHEMAQLRAEYEKWENETNRQSARSFVEQVQPSYANALVVFQRILPHLTSSSSSYYSVLDIELENPLRLSQKSFSQRLTFLFRSFEYKLPGKEDILFLHSFYLGVSAIQGLGGAPAREEDGISSFAALSPFISVWYSFVTKKNLFNFDCKGDYELVLINYLEWMHRNKGYSALREKLTELMDSEISSIEKRTNGSPYIYIYAVEKELQAGSNKERAYKLFSEIIRRYPDSSFVAEVLFDLFSRLDGDGNIILYYRNIKKTARLWEYTAEYMRKNGTVEEYREVLVQWAEAQKRGDILPPVSLKPVSYSFSGSQGVYENAVTSFGFYGLRFGNADLIAEFLEKIPALSPEENILKNVSLDSVVELFASL